VRGGSATPSIGSGAPGPEVSRWRVIASGFTFMSVSLGVSCAVAYGTIFYSFAILAPAIMADFGWSSALVYGAFSAALAGGGLASPLMGRLIDRFGARPVMSTGSVLVSLLLAALSTVGTPFAFVALQFLMLFAGVLILYDAAFAALAENHGIGARAQISVITLIAGFSSTLFWPLTSWLLASFGWRGTYLALAGITLALTLPVHLLLPSRAKIAARQMLASGHFAAEPPPLDPAERRRAVIIMAIAFSCGSFTIMAVQAHYPRLLLEAGFGAAGAAFFAGCIGPFQVSARLVDMVFAQKYHPVRVGTIATLSMALGVTVLFFLAAGPTAAILFAVFYGAGQGMAHILWGNVPLALFGPKGYARLSGNLGSMRLLVGSAAPLAVALAGEHLGSGAGTALIVAVAGLGFLMILPLLRYVRSQPS